MRQPSGGGCSVPDQPRRRTWALQLVIGILLAALAFTIVVQWRQTDEDSYEGLRKNELVELLKSLDSANERVSNRIREMTQTRNELRTDTRKSQAAGKVARQRAQRLSILAGAVPAKGPGIVITIDDPEHLIDSAILLDAVQELRDAGAEVIAVNDSVRIVANSYFLNDDDQVKIDGQSVSRPFTIQAIGDPHTLATAMQFRGGLTDRVETRGANMAVHKHKKISVTALAELKSQKVARSSD